MSDQCIYEGHSINMLQNSIILLVFQTLKIWNIRFVGNLILSCSYEFYDDDITGTSFIYISVLIILMSFIYIKFDDVATEIVPITNSVPLLYFCGQKKNYCKSDLLWDACSIWHKCFTKRIVHVWCKKMLDGQKFVSYTRVQSVVFQWHGQQPASFFSSGIQKFVTDRTNVWANLVDMLKNETLVFSI